MESWLKWTKAPALKPGYPKGYAGSNPAGSAMNHKRRKPKDARAGCLLCKPHKSNAYKDSAASRRPSQVRADDAYTHELAEAFHERDQEMHKMPVPKTTT